MANQPLVLVTGVSGYLGSHVVDQLLKGNYRVRGTVRSPKVAAHKKVYSHHGDRVDIVAIDDLINGDFTSVLEGVSAVIHVASPLSGRADVESTLNSAIDGTTNVLKQAAKAGIKHIAVTSSLAANVDMTAPKPLLTETDWNPVTREQALSQPDNDSLAYLASKTLAERAVWKLADEHPDLNITTVNPPYFIGPFAPGMIIEPGNLQALSTNVLIYNLLLPDSVSKTPPFGYVDVRDVAGALIAGINVDGRNRALLMGEWFEHKDAVAYIASVRPELKTRLPDNLVPTGQTQGIVDNSRAIEILGIPPVRKWKESVLEAADSMIAIEKDWIEKGIDVNKALKGNPWRNL